VPQKVNPVDPDSDEAGEIWDEFRDKVNMTRSALEKWLDTDESKSVGQKDGGGESVGHDSGRRIMAILDKKKADLDGEDLAHMKKTNGYIARHLKQRPDKSEAELAQTDWTYSLRNWGHDPVK
jgi:hypothetical protein